MAQRNAHNVLSNYKTVVTNDNGTLKCIYVSTVIVAHNSESLILNSGGYQTVTTKKKMNQFSHQYLDGIYSVYQRKRVWYVDYEGETYPFNDGMDLVKLNKLSMHCATIDANTRAKLAKGENVSA